MTHPSESTTPLNQPRPWISGLPYTRGSSVSADPPKCLLPSARKKESLRWTKPGAGAWGVWSNLNCEMAVVALYSDAR